MGLDSVACSYSGFGLPYLQVILTEIHTYWPFSSPLTLISELTGSLLQSRDLGALLLRAVFWAFSLCLSVAGGGGGSGSGGGGDGNRPTGTVGGTRQRWLRLVLGHLWEGLHPTKPLSICR